MNTERIADLRNQLAALRPQYLSLKAAHDNGRPEDAAELQRIVDDMLDLHAELTELVRDVVA